MKPIVNGKFLLEKYSREIMQLVVLLLFTTMSFVFKANAQDKIKLTTLSLTELPKGVMLEGKLKKAVRWTDKSGDNITVLSETGAFQSPKFKHENEGSDAELFAYHYSINDSIQLVWKVYDFINDCPVDIEAEFINNTPEITDLNGNGIAEVWIMYKTVCHGDVSPCDMKIIMYEGLKKYAMRGRNKVKLSATEYEGGEYKMDDAFNKAPEKFRLFAEKLWKANIMQVWD